MLSATVTDLAGEARAHPSPALRVRRRINGYAEVSFPLNALEDAADEIEIASRAVQIYDQDAGALRFFGKIHEPTSISSRQVSVVAKDPYADLGERTLRADLAQTADAGELLWALVAAENVRANTRIRRGTIIPSTGVTREYAQGKSVGEIGRELGEIENGPWFTIEPVAGVAGILGELNVRGATSGEALTDVYFEYGEGTRDNCSDFRIDYRLPRNSVRATGAPDDAGVRLSHTASDAASIATYGLYDLELAIADVTDLPTLQQRATAALMLEPEATYQVTPTADAPVLLRDFDVGDLVQLKILHGTLDVEVQARVVEAELEQDAAGVQRTTDLVLADLTVRRLPRRREDVLRAALLALQGRIAALERAPLAGP